MKEIGNLKILSEENQAKFPACRTIFIDDKTKVIIDPGSDENILRKILEKNTINFVFNTHYHFDHIRNNFLFEKSKIYMNEIESVCFIDRTNIPKKVGVYEVFGQKGIEDWLKYTKNPKSEQTPYSPSRNHKWFLSSQKLDGTYHDDQVFNFGSTEMKIIHTPGHSEGFSCLLFSNEGAIYTGDIDLSLWGPWYSGTDSSIQDFINSADKIAKYKVEYFITAHEIGILTRDDFRSKLKNYLAIIDKRETKILEKLKEHPWSLEELSSFGLLYGGKKFLVDPWVFAWERVGIRQHLDWLEKKDVIIKENAKYNIK